MSWVSRRATRGTEPVRRADGRRGEPRGIAGDPCASRVGWVVRPHDPHLPIAARAVEEDPLDRRVLLQRVRHRDVESLPAPATYSASAARPRLHLLPYLPVPISRRYAQSHVAWLRICSTSVVSGLAIRVTPTTKAALSSRSRRSRVTTPPDSALEIWDSERRQKVTPTCAKRPQGEAPYSLRRPRDEAAVLNAGLASRTSETVRPWSGPASGLVPIGR